jgi:hypothetical protein
MKFVEDFNSYKLNEALGIAESTLFYVDIIKQKVMEEVIDYINDCITLNQKEVKQITIPYREIRRHVTNWEVYKEFPVSEILVDVEIVKKRKDLIKRMKFLTDVIEETPFKVGGYASPFARGRERAAARIKDPVRMTLDHSLLIHMGIEVEYSDNFDLYIHERKLETQIESVILHELNHTYEYYNRKLGGARNMDLALTYASTGKNVMRRPKVIFDYWQYYFTDFIYMSEPHEVRAYIQESKSFVDKLDFESFQKTTMWKVAKYMQEYSYKKFLTKFDRVVEKYNPEYVDKITDVLIKDFIKEYKKHVDEFKETPLIDPEKLSYMTREEFFEYWQNYIRKAGDKIVRGMYRLYAYKRNKEEELY